MTPIKVHALKGLRLFEMRLHVEGRFPVKFLAFVHMCVQEENLRVWPRLFKGWITLSTR